MEKVISGKSALLALLFHAIALAGILPSKTEVNLGSFPVDQYGDSVLNNSNILPNCPTNISVRECIKRFFNNNPANGTVVAGNYVSQGVTGVRFFLALGEGGGVNGYGTGAPFIMSGTSRGTWRQEWVDKIGLLFSDLKNYGRISRRPSLLRRLHPRPPQQAPHRFPAHTDLLHLHQLLPQVAVV